MIIELDGLPIQFSRKRIKNINLRINAHGEVKVSAPLKLPLLFVHRFLQEKKDWITSRISQLQTQSVMPRTKEMKTGERHFFLGNSYTLIVHENAKKTSFWVDDESMNCSVTAQTNSLEKHDLLQSFYREQMKLLLPNLIKKWELIIGVEVLWWGVKAMKTRWGSCIPSKKRVWINLHLMQKPLICLEYVIVHELVHLLEASHNTRFYALMSQYMPDWRVYRKQLKA